MAALTYPTRWQKLLISWHMAGLIAAIQRRDKMRIGGGHAINMLMSTNYRAAHAKVEHHIARLSKLDPKFPRSSTLHL